MTATLLVHGTIRKVEERTSKNGHAYREVSIVTEFGSVLGDTMRVDVWEPRNGEDWPLVAPALVVNWVIEARASQGGYLNGRFRAVATPEDFDAALRASGVRALVSEGAGV